jgi:hypothetical protein
LLARRHFGQPASAKIETALLSIPSDKIRNQPRAIGTLAKLDARSESAVGIVVFHLSKSYLCGDHLVVGKILLAEPVQIYVSRSYTEQVSSLGG